MIVDLPRAVAARDVDDATLLAVADLVLEVAGAEGLDCLLAPRDGLARTVREGVEPGHHALLAVVPGAGAALALLPQEDNLDRASVEVSVAPASRRRGLGRGLVAEVARAAQERGRRVVDVYAPTGSVAERLGLSTGLTDVQQERESSVALPEHHGTAVSALAEAAPHADGYALRAWEGDVPDDLVTRYAVAAAALHDAPRGDSTWQPPTPDADQLRRRSAVAASVGLHHHHVVAVHEATGEIGGFTDVVVWPDHPVGQQWDTGVARAHRGHRLGLLVKAEMALRLAREEPQVESLHTWNAQENAHMIAVNERLGWQPVRSWTHLEGPLEALLGVAP